MASNDEKIAANGDEAVQIDVDESAMNAHFLLRGGRPSYENKKYSEAQMESLTALCDTLFPSLDHHAISDTDEIKSFYGTSASQAGIPLHVDEKNENPSWKAMGYCGPDPDLQFQRRTQPKKAPLHEKIIDMQGIPSNNITKTLCKAGCQVTESHSKSITINCDVVVVGSGSGGGVVAGQLSKAGHKVIVVEKGKYFARNDLSLLEGPTLDQMYEGGGLLATDDLGVVLLAGSTVGGGSCINWSASLHTPNHVISEWSDELKLPLFKSPQFLEAMDAVCERMGVKEEICSEGMANKVLRRGCGRLKYEVHDIPRNGEVEHRCGWCCFGCKDGVKQGTQETWLVDAVNHGAVILSSCKAQRIIVKKGNRMQKAAAAGVVIEAGGNRAIQIQIHSRATVISCGALCTPSLLKNSGLKNPNIGRNLHLHPVQMAWGFFPEATGNSYEGPIMSAMHPLEDPSGYGTIIQTPSLHPGLFSVITPWISSLDMRQRMLRFSKTTHLFALTRDTGSGEVNLPGHLTYKMSSKDERNLNRGIERALRILVAAGAEEIGTHHCKGESLKVTGSSPEEVERFIKKVSLRKLKGLSTPLCSAHQMGSCRMGADERVSAVDGRGESWEVKGLFVADASVLPTAVGVNPMVTVQSVAYCIANFVHHSLTS